jgi:hypothetical protein
VDQPNVSDLILRLAVQFRTEHDFPDPERDLIPDEDLETACEDKEDE